MLSRIASHYKRRSRTKYFLLRSLYVPPSFLPPADDIAQMADQFGVQRFYVAGMSGGGPYALATLTYLPLRVKGTLVNCAAGSWGDIRPHVFPKLSSSLTSMADASVAVGLILSE